MTLSRLLHRIGLHAWRHVWGSHNRYYECRICEARQVRIGQGGYQPVDLDWLNHKPPRPRTPPGKLAPPLPEHLDWNWRVIHRETFPKPLPVIPPEEAPQ